MQMINKELKFLLKHSSIYGIGTMASQAVGFFLLPLYTAYLTPADYGVLSLINISIDIVGLILTLGIINAMSRFYFDYDTENAKQLVISTIYGTFAIMTIIFLPILYFSSVALSGLIFDTKEYVRHFLVAFAALLFCTVVDIGLSYLRIKAQSVKYVKVSLLRTLMLIGFNIYFIVYLRIGVIGIFYSSLITALIFSVVLSVPILKETKLFFSIKLASEMIRFSFPLIFSNVFRIIANQSDKYLINHFFSPFETGIYSIAQKIGTAIHMVITSPFLQTYLPRRFEIMKKDDAKETYSSILNYYLIAIGTAGLVLSVFSREIVQLMTSKEFYASARYIPLVALSMIIFGLKYHFEIGIMIRKKTKYIAYINGISAVANIVLNYYLIQAYMLWGALIASNVSILLTTSLNLIFSQQFYSIKFDSLGICKMFALLFLFYTTSTFIDFGTLYYNLLPKVGLLIFYALALISLRIIQKDSLTHLKHNFTTVSTKAI
jgi:O-antigen/teichoic acid export membrane protein